MGNFDLSKADWSKITIPQGTTEEEAKRAYESTLDDLRHLERDFIKHFTMRHAQHQIQVEFLSDLINTHVYYNGDVIDTSSLVPFVPGPDRQLFKDVVLFTFQYVNNKPKTQITLMQFKGMLIFFLAWCGF